MSCRSHGEHLYPTWEARRMSARLVTTLRAPGNDRIAFAH
jgi:hypothetical protein